MNLEELQTARDRERQTDKLQQLRESFYADAGEFIQQLQTEVSDLEAYTTALEEFLNENGTAQQVLSQRQVAPAKRLPEPTG